MTLGCPGCEPLTSSFAKLFQVKMRPFGEAAGSWGGTGMVGRVWTCVRPKSFAELLLVISAVFALATPAAGRAAESSNSTGTASAGSASSAVLECTPKVVRFENVPAGDTYTQTVKITNVSGGAFQIKRIAASSRDFGITGILLPVVVAPGTSETFTISYQGRAEAPAEAQIRIVTSVGDVPLVLKASTVKDERELTASEARIDFEDVALGSSSQREVVLTNSGNRALSISGISVSGSEFGLSGAGAVSLSPGQKVNLAVNFAPKSTGGHEGRLTVLSAEGESLLELPLSAVGVAASQNVVKLNWEESPASVGGYLIYRSSDPTGPYTRLSSQAIPSAEYVDTGLAAGHTYYYVVTAVGADDVESEYSAPISATVPEA